VDEVADLLCRLDEGELGDPLPVLAFLAGQEVEVPAGALNEARRRALLLLAAGGDPHRELGLDDRAVKSLAADLHTEDRRRALAARIDELAVLARDLPRVRAAAIFLAGDVDLAWRMFALALLAEELGN
jgi:hypothetical protein